MAPPTLNSFDDKAVGVLEGESGARDNQEAQVDVDSRDTDEDVNVEHHIMDQLETSGDDDDIEGDADMRGEPHDV